MPIKKASYPKREARNRLLNAKETEHKRRKNEFIKKRGKRIVVHLGNVGDNPEQTIPLKQLAKKTAEYAKRFSDTQFIGIDLQRLRREKTNNWIQEITDFEYGLEKLKDNSVDLVSSELGVGYYGANPFATPGDKTRYTFSTIKTAFHKLKPKGKLMLVVDEGALSNIQKGIRDAGFDPKKVVVYRIPEKSLDRTRWMSKGKGLKGFFFQVIAQK